MNKKIITLLILVGLFMTALTASAQVAFDWPYKTVDGTIVTQVPERPAGQQPALGLTAPKLKDWACSVPTPCAALPISTAPR